MTEENRPYICSFLFQNHFLHPNFEMFFNYLPLTNGQTVLASKLRRLDTPRRRDTPREDNLEVNLLRCFPQKKKVFLFLSKKFRPHFCPVHPGYRLFPLYEACLMASIDPFLKNFIHLEAELGPSGI